MSNLKNRRYHDAAALPLNQGDTPEQRLAAWCAVVALAEQEQHGIATTDLVACGPGCDTCCSVNVSILEPEALAIVDYLDRHFSSDAQEALQQRLDKLHHETRWLDDEERMMVRKACAFLDEHGSCSIHPARPLLCRSLTSIDPEQCKDAISMLALGAAPRIVCNLEQQRIYHEAYLGLASALEEEGLDHQSHRLTSLLNERLAK